MKKKLIFGSMLAIMLVLSLAVIGCDSGSSSGGGGKTLASIAITTQATKRTYMVGETLDTAGMVVTATYSDGSTAAITGFTTSGFNSNAAAANQTVTVSYTEGGVTKTTTFTVTIGVNKTAVTLYWVNEQGRLVFSGDAAASITNAAEQSVTVTPQGEGYTDQRWYSYGVEDTAKAGQSSYTFNGAEKTAGRYTIGLRVAKGGGYYYAEYTVTVTN